MPDDTTPKTVSLEEHRDAIRRSAREAQKYMMADSEITRLRRALERVKAALKQAVSKPEETEPVELALGISIAALSQRLVIPPKTEA
jgi:hypothetical protein